LVLASLETAEQRRREGALYESLQILDTALKEVPDSVSLNTAREEIDAERSTRLRINDCRVASARARYLADKSDLLMSRAPLEAKDFLQDWQSRREREELAQLAVQTRDCGNFALNEQRLDLADETLSIAARVNGAEFVAEEQRQLEQLKNPPKAAPPPPPKPKVKRTAEQIAQQKLRRTRLALQSAITRGDLRQARTHIVELRELEGESEQLTALDRSISAAITAYINDAHERANALYRDRQIEQARDIWQRILELDPNDIQARANLERAERVLKKLEELQGITPEAMPEAAEPTAPTQTAPEISGPAAPAPAITAPAIPMPAPAVPAPATTAPAPTAVPETAPPSAPAPAP
ncbi:MAG TPA: hypothetical protein VIR60_08965, partial [Gammaproteobacteria bacterium]